MDDNDTCAAIRDTVLNVNLYFRERDVVEGAMHGSAQAGNAIMIGYFFVILVGALGNFLTITVVILNPAMRTTRNFFILNLALSDFLVCTVTAPMTLYTILYQFWPFGMVMCKIAGSLQGFNVFLSTFSIAAIALDRFVLVIFPTKRREQRNLAIMFFVGIWLVSLTLALPLLIASSTRQMPIPDHCGMVVELCQEQNDTWTRMFISKKVYTVCVLFLQYALPLISLVFAYYSIAMRMHMRIVNRSNGSSTVASSLNRQRRQSAVDRQRRTHLLLVSVVIVFAIVQLPLNVFHVLNTFDVVNFSVVGFALCHMAAMCSACLNPLIYAFFNHNFRNEFIILFDKTGISAVLECMHVRCCSRAKDGQRLAIDKSSRGDLSERLPVLRTLTTANAGNTELVHI